MSLPDPAPVPRSDAYWFWLALLLAVAGLAFHSWRVVPDAIQEAPYGYYGLLTEALAQGQTHLNIEPDPRLAELENPWGGAQDVPRAHDASYYNGRYYLYFGIGPAILLLLPWHLLTGTYLADGTATALFAILAVVLMALLWRRFRTAFLPELTPALSAGVVLTLAFASYVTFLVHNIEFYSVPIATALACAFVAAHAVWGAVVSTRPTRTARWLGLASLALGAAVACRPNYLWSLPVLGAVALALAWPHRRDRGALLKLLLATALPAAVIGVALAYYNYVRFESPFEFGVHYQFASSDQRFIRLFDLNQVPATLRAYLFVGVHARWYFPFVGSGSDTFGVVWWAPWSVLSLTFPATLLVRRWRDRRWIVVGAFLLGCGLMNFGGLLAVPFAFARYQVDFLPVILLVAWVVGPAWWWHSGSWPKASRWMTRFVLIGLASWSIVMGLVHGLPHHPQRQEMQILARAGNHVAAVVERLTGLMPGPLIIEVQFPTVVPGGIHRAPLVVTGGDRDYLYVETHGDATQVKFGLFHRGAGGPTSEWILVEPGRPYEISVDMGSLYPPDTHPHFRLWRPKEVARLRTRLHVKLDGRAVLTGESDFYASDPSQVLLGQSAAADITASRFEGHVRLVRRLGLPETAQASEETGPLRLTVKFPPFAAMVGQPLISTGENGAGDLIYAFRMGPGLLRLGHDSWGYGAVESGPISFDPEVEHVIEVDFGSLHPEARGATVDPRPLRVRFNGLTVLDEPRHYHASEAIDVVVGLNAIRASTAENQFKGPTLRVERLAGWRETPARPTHWGFILSRPIHDVGTEPILATGQAGAGDLLWMQPVDEEHVRFGLDHWGRGGRESPPVRWERGRLATLTVGLGSMMGATHGLVQVWLDGQLVWQEESAFYPATPEQVYPAANAIGASTASPTFSASIELSGPVLFP